MDDYIREHIVDLMRDTYKKNAGSIPMHELIDAFQFFKLSALEVQSLLEWAESYEEEEQYGLQESSALS